MNKSERSGGFRHLLQRGPLAEHQHHGDALVRRLGVEVEEQQLAQRLGRPDLLGGVVELRVADAPTQGRQQPAEGSAEGGAGGGGEAESKKKGWG